MKKFFATVLVVLLSIAGFAATTVFKSPELGFGVSTPVTLTTDGPQQRTNSTGKSFTQTIFTGSQNNGDAYLVGVSEYPFPVVSEDLMRAANGFATATGGTIGETKTLTVSGQPALRATIVLTDKTKFLLLVTFKGSRAYQFAFGTTTGTAFDTPEVKAFFDSATIN